MTDCNTSAHALLRVFSANSVDRVFFVPGESYLGVLDALLDFPEIESVVCRHEGGAGFMAVADARTSGKVSVVMASRGPGASNAAVAIHTAQQDAVPLILVIGQVPKRDLRRGAFQEIDYQKMYGSIAKWVYEVIDPQEMATAAFKAIRVATSGTPGPVVLVLPEDIQQQHVDQPKWKAVAHRSVQPGPDVIADVVTKIRQAKKPLIIAGGMFERPGGRDALRRFAEAWNIPVAVSFRRHDVFPPSHPLHVGELGLVNPDEQISVFGDSDLILALGTRLDDITTQGYTFPACPMPDQVLVHCYPDQKVVGATFSSDIGLVCDPIALTKVLADHAEGQNGQHDSWVERLRAIHAKRTAWPARSYPDGLEFWQVVKSVSEHVSDDAIVCLDAGTFAAPVYRYFHFKPHQRLMAPISGAMGYGVPAAIACALRYPERQVICMVGDGGFLMNGSEIIAAVERRLPILFIISNNNCYASIRVNQEREYPGRVSGTTLFNPDFASMAQAYGMPSWTIDNAQQIDAAINKAQEIEGPVLLEVRHGVESVLPN